MFLLSLPSALQASTALEMNEMRERHANEVACARASTVTAEKWAREEVEASIAGVRHRKVILTELVEAELTLQLTNDPSMGP